MTETKPIRITLTADLFIAVLALIFRWEILGGIMFFHFAVKWILVTLDLWDNIRGKSDQ